MKTDPLKQGALTENFAGLGTVTPEMVQKRAGEVAIINGRSAEDASVTDWEQAKRELTGETDQDPQDEILEATSEEERWNPVAGSAGHQAPVTSNEDEDEEGRSDSERLVDAGVAEAEHDQMLQAARAGRERNGA